MAATSICRIVATTISSVIGCTLVVRGPQQAGHQVDRRVPRVRLAFGHDLPGDVVQLETEPGDLFVVHRLDLGVVLDGQFAHPQQQRVIEIKEPGERVRRERQCEVAGEVETAGREPDRREVR